jgi:Na+-driven multidrug efflux pump
VFWTHSHKERAGFIIGAYKSLKVPGILSKQIFAKGMPLLLNEFLWSAGMAMLTQSYSTRGLAVVAGLNISTTIANLFNVVWIAMGTAVAIMVGQQLGANEFKRAKQSVRRLMAFSVFSAVCVGSLLAILAPLFPQMYNTTDEVRHIASGLLLIAALAAPIHSFVHVSYFTLRSGGKTWITFLFDCVYLWVLSIPLARFLSDCTTLPILPIYAICQFIDIVKCIIGFWMIKKGLWINNIVDEQ